MACLTIYVPNYLLGIVPFPRVGHIYLCIISILRSQPANTMLVKKEARQANQKSSNLRKGNIGMANIHKKAKDTR